MTKRQRVPLSDAGLKRLQVPVKLDEKNFSYRWMNDAPGRIEAAKAGGYEIVDEPGAVDRGGEVGTAVSQVNNRGTGQRSILMRLPMKLYKEDQEAKEKINQTVDDSISRQSFKGRELEEAYVPEGGGIKFTR